LSNRIYRSIPGTRLSQSHLYRLPSQPKLTHSLNRSIISTRPPMTSTSTLSLYSHPKLSLRPRLSLSAYHALLRNTVTFNVRRRFVVVMADGGASRRPSTGRRVVYRESQSQTALTTAPVKQVASSVAPAAVFLIATFGMEIFCCFTNTISFRLRVSIWKLV
jgi:hypothetical protein